LTPRPHGPKPRALPAALHPDILTTFLTTNVILLHSMFQFNLIFVLLLQIIVPILHFSFKIGYFRMLITKYPAQYL